MKERGILFSAPMVRALLDGTKTQTRRALKRQPWASCSIEEGNEGESPFVYSALHGAGPGHDVEESRTPCRCPYGQPGDRLWVRETCWIADGATDLGGVVHCADHEGLTMGGMKKRPSIHMPRWASRILLEITDVRVERLQNISEDDCWAEGIEAVDGALDDLAIIGMARRMGRQWEDAAPTYAALWESINGARSWDANPWVWVVEFRRIER